MEDQRNYYAYLVLALGLASVVLAMAAMYVSQIVAINYGVGAGAIIQSTADKVNVTSALIDTTAQLKANYKTLYETYILLALALGMIVAAFSLYLNRADRYGGESRVYLAAHAVVSIVYIAIFFVIEFGLQLSGVPLYNELMYFSMMFCIIIDAYLLYVNHIERRRVGGMKGEVTLEPSKPFTNLLNLKSEVFSKFEGSLRIVDKHFNSASFANLHRLMSDNTDNIKEMQVITSGEMLDGEFNKTYIDYKNELKESKIAMNVFVMSREDSEDQHERYVFDNSIAYKIPPFNIIHKRSEHITKINIKDAKDRFGALMRHAMKYENFINKRNQDNMKKTK